MKTILEGLYIGKDGKRKPESKIIGAIFYLFLAVTLGFSIYGLYATGKNNLNYKLYTYKFDSNEQRKNIPDGLAVSLDQQGRIRRGGGYTLYRNISDTTGALRVNLKVQMSGSTAVSVSNGELYLQYINSDRVVSTTVKKELDMISGKQVQPVYLIKMTDEIFVICANAHFIPFKVVTKVDGDKVELSSVFGEKVLIHSEDEAVARYSQVDNLNNSTLAYTYEQQSPKKIMGSLARLDLATLKFSPIKAHQEIEAGVYAYHRVVGFRSNLFMLACNGVLMNENGQVGAENSSIRVRLITIDENDVFTMGAWVIRESTENLSYFASDNLSSSSAIIAYYCDTRCGGVYTLVVQVRTDSDGKFVPVFGGFLTVESGGATIGSGSSISLRVLNNVQFGVVFPDMSSGGSMVYMMGELSPNGDLNRVAQSMIVTRLNADSSNLYFDIAAWSMRHVVIVDSFSLGAINHSVLSVGDNLAAPLGISWSLAKASYEVQTSGVYKFSNKKLVPGMTYYTDSTGEIFPGSYYGYDNYEFGVFYISKSSRIMSVMNQIGIAVSENEMLIRTR